MALPLLLAWFSSALAAPPPLSVVSVNAWGVPNVVHPLHSNEGRLHGALGEYLAEAQRFDVVAVQEVWREMWRPDVRRGDFLADVLGVVPTWIGPVGRGGRVAPLPRAETGLAFALPGARWTPVSVPEQHPFAARGRSFDGFKHKGFARVVVRAEAEGAPVEVVVINTHLQAENLFGAHADATVRQAQVLETLAALTAEARPVVWIGDFNLAEGASAAGRVDAATVEAVRAAGFREGADFVPALAASASNVDGGRYDRVWVRGSAEWGLTVEDAAAHVHGGDPARTSVIKQLSDHLPLEVTVAVTRR